MSVKLKLILLASISILGMVILIFLLNYSVSSTIELNNAQTQIKELNSNMLTLRRNEKDFLARKDLKYKDKFTKNIQNLQKNAKILEDNLATNNISTKNLQEFNKIIKEYQTIFLKLVATTQTIGLNPKDGLYGSLRDAVHKVQDYAKKSNDYKLLAKVYDLRKQEKDFMLRFDTKYVDKFKTKIDKLISETNSDMSLYLQTYRKDFLALIEQENIIGLNSKSGIQGNMRNTIHKTESILKTISKEANKNIIKNINKLKYTADIIAVILIALVLIIASILIKNILHKLHDFQIGVLQFFRYLNRETQEIHLLDDKSTDEFGEMAKVVNENIIKTKKAVEEDRQVINDTIEVLSEFEQGDLYKRVTTKSNNPALQELTKLLNQMAAHIELNVENVLDVLEQYSNNNYMNRVKTDGIKEHLLKLANGVNTLGDAITTMLVDNKSNGLTLDNSSDILLKNVDILNQNSNEAAAALEETAAALEEITSNISNNTHHIVEMSKLASNVTDSASKGEALASQTTKAMDEIDQEVNAINEAITVIDQIAFQTNILSLNAAVEAATAGEAGKGFAVVAQEVRNLASRSADAANEIKALVENATTKSNNGKKISDEMISGYTALNENISKTIDLIKDVEMASKEQLTGIEQINDAVNSLDQQTQQNAMIASQTHDVALETDTIAKLVVKDADAKEFIGKNMDKRKEPTDLHYQGKERRKREKIIKEVITEKHQDDFSPQTSPQKQTSSSEDLKIVQTSTTEHDDWESF